MMRERNVRGKGGGKVRVTPQTSVICECILLELSTHRIKLLLAAFKYSASAAKKEFSLHRMRREERFSSSFQVWERKREREEEERERKREKCKKLSQKLLRRGWGKSCRWVADRKKQVYSWSRFLSLSFFYFFSPFLSFCCWSAFSYIRTEQKLMIRMKEWMGKEFRTRKWESELFSLIKRGWGERERREREKGEGERVAARSKIIQKMHIVDTHTLRHSFPILSW